MSTDFAVAAKNSPNIFRDNTPAKNDVVNYTIDFSAWAEDNDTIDSVTWTVESGQVGIDDQDLDDNIASANVTFNERGFACISIFAIGVNLKRKVFLYLNAKDPTYGTLDDYGINS